jgi:hypothetical protein
MKSVTGFGYVRQIFDSLRKHPWESALVVACIIIYLWAGPLRTSVLLPLVVATLMLQIAVAGWRVYRTQQIVITAKQTLIDLDDLDRADSEQKLRAHYVHREEKLTDKIAALTARLRGEQ